MVTLKNRTLSPIVESFTKQVLDARWQRDQQNPNVNNSYFRSYGTREKRFGAAANQSGM
jgi:hypothetical protein